MEQLLIHGTKYHKDNQSSWLITKDKAHKEHLSFRFTKDHFPI